MEHKPVDIVEKEQTATKLKVTKSISPLQAEAGKLKKDARRTEGAESKLDPRGL
jgi:hypothetical protein